MREVVSRIWEAPAEKFVGMLLLCVFAYFATNLVLFLVMLYLHKKDKR